MFDLPTKDLGKADVHFLVKNDGAVLGKLEVSRGSIVWYPKGATLGHKIRWRQLNEIAQQFPRVERRKPRR